MKYWHTEKLNTRLDYMLRQVVTCQNVFRGRKARQEYKRLCQRSWEQTQLATEFLEGLEGYSGVLVRTMSKMDQHDKERHEAKKRQVRLRVYFIGIFIMFIEQGIH